MRSGEAASPPPSGFRNTDADTGKRKGFARWQWQRWKSRLPKPPAEAHSNWRVAPDLALLHTPAGNPSVTWIGHATCSCGWAGAMC